MSDTLLTHYFAPREPGTTTIFHLPLPILHNYIIWSPLFPDGSPNQRRYVLSLRVCKRMCDLLHNSARFWKVLRPLSWCWQVKSPGEPLHGPIDLDQLRSNAFYVYKQGFLRHLEDRRKSLHKETTSLRGMLERLEDRRNSIDREIREQSSKLQKRARQHDAILVKYKEYTKGDRHQLLVPKILNKRFKVDSSDEGDE